MEELDRQLEFLAKEFAHVRHARAAAAEENSSRRSALLLCAIMTDRPHDLRMQSRHGTADDFRDARDIRVGGLCVSAAETYKSFAFLTKLRRRHRLAEFLRDR